MEWEVYKSPQAEGEIGTRAKGVGNGVRINVGNVGNGEGSSFLAVIGR